jgi:hypothetical protein
MKMVAHCYSDRCATTIKGSKLKFTKGTIKDVKRTTDFCEECGHSLVWKKERRQMCRLNAGNASRTPDFKKEWV